MRNLQTIQRHIPTIDRIDSYSETTLGMCTTFVVTGLILVLVVPFFNMCLPFDWEGRHNYTTSTTTTTLAGTTTTSSTTVTSTTTTTTTTTTPRPLHGEGISEGELQRGYTGIPAIVEGRTHFVIQFKSGDEDAVLGARPTHGDGAHGEGLDVWEYQIRKRIVPFSLSDHFNIGASNFQVASIRHSGEFMPDGRFIREAHVSWNYDTPDGASFGLRMMNASLLVHILKRQTQAEISFWDSIKQLNVTNKAQIEFYGIAAMSTRHGNFLEVQADGRIFRAGGGERRMLEEGQLLHHRGDERPLNVPNPISAAVAVALFALAFSMLRGRPKPGWQP